MDARPVRGRRAADAGRHAIRLLDIGARGRRHGRPQPAAGAPSSSARRPDRLAFYMGYCPHRREGHVSCGTRDGRKLSRARLGRYACSPSLSRRLAGAGPDASVSSGAGMRPVPVKTPASPASSDPSPRDARRLVLSQLGNRAPRFDGPATATTWPPHPSPRPWSKLSPTNRPRRSAGDAQGPSLGRGYASVMPARLVRRSIVTRARLAETALPLRS